MNSPAKQSRKNTAQAYESYLAKDSDQARFELVASCAGGFEQLLADEILSLLKTKSLSDLVLGQGSISLSAGLEELYTLCICSRLSESILLKVLDLSIEEKDQVIARERLYKQVKSVPWEQLFSLEKSFRIDFSGSQSIFDDNRFAALICKDALVDRFRYHFEKRPSIDRESPDVILQLFGNQRDLSLYLNVSGEPLHKRGYRKESVEAPLKETLASALLYQAGWHKHCDDLAYFLDPCCGSGTLAIEALLIAANIAPGLERFRNPERFFCFENLSFYQEDNWEEIAGIAEQAAGQGLDLLKERGLKLRAYDSNMKAVKAAQANLAAIDLSAFIHFEKRSFFQLGPLKDEANKKGMVLCNPPYGERLQEADELKYLYRLLGNKLARLFPDWYVGVISSQVELLDVLGFEDFEQSRFYNGNLRCFFRHSKLADIEQEPRSKNYFLDQLNNTDGFDDLDERVVDFKNRLIKNLRKLKPWLKKSEVSSFRLYDGDMPEFNMAIDCYQSDCSQNGKEAFVVVFEYAAPKSVSADIAKERLSMALHCIRLVFSLQREQVFVKTRARQKGKQQYLSKSDSSANKSAPAQSSKTKLLEAEEAGLHFLINPSDYLDTGLFIDHRLIRDRIRQESKGKRVLNLFSYTGSASVYAAAGGAKSTLSVDLSNTYLAWGRKNFLANGFSLENNLSLKSDVLQYLRSSKEQFDVIFLDPPTFSNSKKKQLNFDVQSDHEELIRLAMARLDGAGKLYFSCNYKGFELADNLSERYKVEEITKQTVSPDFSRKQPHRAWLLAKNL